MRRVLATVFALGSSACGTGGNPGPSGAGGATSASGSATTGSQSTASGTTSASGTASTASGNGGCVGTVDFTVDGGATTHYASACNGVTESTTAVGYVIVGGGTLWVSACSGSAPSGADLGLVTNSTVGTDPNGSAFWTDANGVSWSGSTADPAVIDLTRVDPVGGVIEGHFTANVTQVGGSATHALEGTFHACRIMDAAPP